MTGEKRLTPHPQESGETCLSLRAGPTECETAVQTHRYRYRRRKREYDIPDARCGMSALTVLLVILLVIRRALLFGEGETPDDCQPVQHIPYRQKGTAWPQLLQGSEPLCVCRFLLTKAHSTQEACVKRCCEELHVSVVVVTSRDGALSCRHPSDSALITHSHSSSDDGSDHEAVRTREKIRSPLC